jgi:hypothetical protein
VLVTVTSDSRCKDHRSRLGSRSKVRHSMLVSPELFHNVRCKFTDDITGNSPPRLRDDALISLDYKRRIIRIPGCGDRSRSECRRKRHDIWPDGLFTAIIGYEVSGKRVTKPWPGSVAPAAVVARFPSNDSLPQRGE